MSMEMRIDFRPNFLEAAIMNVGDQALKNMARTMQRTAVRVRDLARDYAPRDTGLLEESIDYAVVKDAKTRRNVYVVFIDVDAIRKRGAGNLGQYAWIMEENLHPYGRGRVRGRELRLGPGSRDKRAEGKKVGGRFLSRAVKEGAKQREVEMECGVEVRRLLGGSGLVQKRTNPYREEDED